MSTTYSGAECPHCKSNDCYYIFSSSEYRRTILCVSCGYERYTKLKRDNEGNVMLKDESKDTDWENIINELEYEKVDCRGSYNYNHKGVIKSGTFSTSEELNKMLDEFHALDGPNLDY